MSVFCFAHGLSLVVIHPINTVKLGIFSFFQFFRIYNGFVNILKRDLK